MTTTQEAHRLIAPFRTALQQSVYLYIRNNNGCTDEEVQDGLNLNPSTQRPRRIELVQLGLIKETAKRRRTKSGRWAIVWEIAEPAKL
jgi:predicted transcriptional regulator